MTQEANQPQGKPLSLARMITKEVLRDNPLLAALARQRAAEIRNLAKKS